MFGRSAAVLVLFALAASTASAEEPWGWIRVKCPPGVRISVDGQFRGTCAEPGLVIDKVTAGVHVVAAESPGKPPLEARVHVYKHWASVIELQAFELLADPKAGNANARAVCLEGEGAITASWPSPGWINLDARPHAEVYLEGLKLGETPLANVKLPAGCVRLRFVDPTTRAEQVRAVWVEPNETSAYRCRLNERACATASTSARERP
jgi:hypothetical protein